jgi:transposase
MHIDDSTYTINGKTYRRVLLRNSYRADGKVRHDTIANLSKCSDEEIAAIKLALKHKSSLQQPENKKPLDQIQSNQGLSIGAIWVLLHLAKRIGLVSALGQTRQASLVLWMVFATVIAQGSRLSAVRLVQQHAVCDVLNLDTFHEDHLYDAMSWLDKQQTTIEDQLFARRLENGQLAPNLYLYDVTSSYLEGNKNELAQYGYNRDKKSGKKQIVIGLLTDDNGSPVSIEVFHGNTQDPKTVNHQIKKLKDRFGVQCVTVVGDRGMIKNSEIEQLHEHGFHYITAITKPQIEHLVHQGIFQFSLFDDKLVEIEDNGVRYVLRKNPVRAQEIDEHRNSKWDSFQKFVKKENNYLAEHPKAKIGTALSRIQIKATKLNITEWITITEEERSIAVTIDHDKLIEAARLDGCYVLKSDLCADVSARTIHDRYKDLTKVEQAFRTMKTVLLEMRGIFVRTEEHTRAHVFIVMMAYLLARELDQAWREMNVTVGEGLTELISIQTTYFSLDGKTTIQTIPQPRPLGKMLLDNLGITLPDVLPHRNVVVVTRKKLPDTRKIK